MRNLFYSVSVSFITFGNSIIFLSPIKAQVTIDNTTETRITNTSNGVQIDGGNKEGGNLFHSFQKFSIPTGKEAFFNNELDVVNIFSRVTGGNLSSIDGLIRANGGANLFLVNPAGIIFGENARLDIGGSFYGSTAESILFPDGIEFSATDIQQPFLTINAPIGLNFRDNPGAIVNRSFVVNSTGDFVGLEVNSGETLALIGGDINFEGGEATAKGGDIEIGGLSAAGTVSLNDDGSLSFPQDIARADITLSNAADIDVSGTGGGNVTVNGRNIILQSGEFGGSQIRAGIIADSDSTNNPEGDITINATGDLVIDESFVYNQIEPETTQNTGDINISANSISISNLGGISNNNFGAGQVGNINIFTNSLSVSNSGDEGIRSSALGTGNAGKALPNAWGKM